MNRKKPTGEEYITFIDRWQAEDHAGKMYLAEQYGVGYDTMRHWFSDGPPAKPKVKEATSIETPAETLVIDIRGELLALQPRMKLDFVCFDIETSNLKADFSIILSAVIKPFGQAPFVFRADSYAAWKNDRANDSAIATDICKELGQHAIVITHFGSKFDLPYLRAKMSRYGLPMLPPMFGVDTYKIAKANYAVSSRRLAALGSYFGIGDKSAVEGNLWNQAALNADSTALDEIVAHNIQDCVMLENLAAMSFPFMRAIPRA